MFILNITKNSMVFFECKKCGNGMSYMRGSIAPSYCSVCFAFIEPRPEVILNKQLYRILHFVTKEISNAKTGQN